MRTYSPAELNALENSWPRVPMISWWQWKADQENNFWLRQGDRRVSTPNFRAETIRHGELQFYAKYGKLKPLA